MSSIEHVDATTNRGKVEVGDDKGGFVVEVDHATAAVQVKGWGFWSVDVASRFGECVMRACQQDRRTRDMVMDMGSLKPMRDEGQDGLAQVIAALPALGIEAATIATLSQLTKLQVLRIVKANDKAGRVRVVEGRAGSGWAR